MSVLRYRLLGDVSVCCEASVGTRCRGRDVSDLTQFLKAPFDFSFFADSTRLHIIITQATLLKEPQPNRPLDPNQPQYRRTPDGDILTAMSSNLSPLPVRAVPLSFTPVRSDQPAAGWTCHARSGSHGPPSLGPKALASWTRLNSIMWCRH